MVAHDGNGACAHLDSESRRCTVWAHRPVPCRAFDCRQDGRIWLSYESRIVNPNIYRDDWPGCLAQEGAEENQG
jgi:Fe-S-cluster containining protein